MSRRALFLSGVLAMAAAVLVGAVSWGAGDGFGVPGRSLSIDQAQQSVQSFLDQSGDRDLQIEELMEFDHNFYALVHEKSTGIGAFELLVDRSTGAVTFEPGPSMMWNTKYSTMGAGMMAGRPFSVRGAGSEMTITPEQATQVAQSWLDRNLAGDSAGTPDPFYGYYTFHFTRAGRIAGMLSVNGYGGQVWFHSWHGSFIQDRDFGA